MAPGRADQVIEELYPNVMHEVIQACLVDFEDAGVSLRILDDLKSFWEQNLTESAIARFPWDPAPRPVEPIEPELIEPELIKPESLDDLLSPTSISLEELQKSYPLPEILPYGFAPLQRYVTAPNSSWVHLAPHNPHVGNDARNIVAAHQQQQTRAPMGHPQTTVSNQLVHIYAGYAPLQHYRMQQGMPLHNLEIAWQRAQQHVQSQQQQQQLISGTVKTTFMGIASVLNNYIGGQQQHQTVHERDVLDPRLSGPDSYEAHGLLIPSMDHDIRISTGLQAQQPAVAYNLNEGNNPCKKHPTTHSRPEYYPYPCLNATPQQKPSGPSQLDGPSDSPSLSTSSSSITVTPLEAVRGIDDKELNDADDDDSPDDGGDEFEEVPKLMMCLYDKVTRTRNKTAQKWRCAFRDGVLVADGKEYVFGKATAELTW